MPPTTPSTRTTTSPSTRTITTTARTRTPRAPLARARTPRRANGPRRRMALSVAVTLMVVLSACGQSDTGETTQETPATTTAAADPSTEPSVTASDAEPTSTPVETAEDAEPPTEVTVEYYLLRENESGLWAEPLTTATTDPGVARVAMGALVDGPTGDLQRLVPDGTTLNSVSLADGTLTVDFTFGPGGLGAAYEDLLVQTIALTGTQFDSVDRVQILVDGEAVDTLFGHVGGLENPVEPDPFRVSPIIITEAMGVGGSGPGGGSIELTGTANTFEATLDLALLDTGGNVIESTFATASCGTGCRGDWSHIFADLEPGRYTVRATEPDPSDGEGGPPFVVELDVTVP